MNRTKIKNKNLYVNCWISFNIGSKTAKNVILSGIVDDGDLQRGFRKNIFNGNLKYAGVGSGKHSAYGTCVVIKYAENYGKKGALKKEKCKPNKNYFYNC